MAFHIHKTQSVAEAIVEQPQIETIQKVSVEAVTNEQALTEEYVILYQKLEEIGGKDLLKRMEAIKKTLQDYANENMVAAEEAAFESNLGTLIFSKRATVTEVPNVGALLDHLENKFDVSVAMSVVKIGITDLKKILSEYELKPFIKETDGARTLKAVAVKQELK